MISALTMKERLDHGLASSDHRGDAGGLRARCPAGHSHRQGRSGTDGEEEKEEDRPETGLAGKDELQRAPAWRAQCRLDGRLPQLLRHLWQIALLVRQKWPWFPQVGLMAPPVWPLCA